jgi:hypothetical protein
VDTRDKKEGGLQYARDRKKNTTLAWSSRSFRLWTKETQRREVCHKIDEKKTLCALGVLRSLGALYSKHKKYRGRGDTTRNKRKKNSLHTWSSKIIKSTTNTYKQETFNLECLLRNSRT